MDGIVDPELYKQLTKKIQDAYLNMGLTIIQHGAQLDNDGDMMVITIAMVRDTAIEQLTQDTDIREQFAAQMAADSDARIESRLEEIARAVEEGRVMQVLTGDEPITQCSHERIHEGLCLDCQKEVTDDDDTET